MRPLSKSSSTAAAAATWHTGQPHACELLQAFVLQHSDKKLTKKATLEKIREIRHRNKEGQHPVDPADLANE